MSDSPPYPVFRSTEFPEGTSTTTAPGGNVITSNEPHNFEPSASRSTMHAADSQSLFEKEQNLMRWEEELRARERNINLNGEPSAAAAATAAAVGTAEINMMTNNPNPMGPPNRPKFHPVTRVAVSEDIPVPNQRLVKFSYVVLIWTTVALIYNIACGIAVIVYSSVGDFFLTLFFFLIGVPYTFFMTRRLYRAARTQKPKATYSFLIGYFGLLCWSLMFFIGFKHSGMHGLLWLISLFHNDHTAVGAMHVISLFLWFVDFFLIAGVFFKGVRVVYGKSRRGEMDYSFKQYLKSR